MQEVTCYVDFSGEKTLTLSLLIKLPLKKIGGVARSMKFLSPEVALYLYKSYIQPCM